MTTNIKTNFKIKSESDSDIVIKILRQEGLNVVNEKELKFDESLNLTTDSGNNRKKLFFTLLKGNLRTETKDQFASWSLQIDEILIKSTLLTSILFLFFHFVYDLKLLFTIIISVFIGGFYLFLNINRQENRIKKISKIIELKL